MDDRGLGQRVRKDDSRALAGFERRASDCDSPRRRCRAAKASGHGASASAPDAGRQRRRAPRLARVDPASRRRPERVSRAPSAGPHQSAARRRDPVGQRARRDAAQPSAPSCASSAAAVGGADLHAGRAERMDGPDFSGSRRRGRVDIGCRPRCRTRASASGTARDRRGWRRRCRPGRENSWRRGSRSSAYVALNRLSMRAKSCQLARELPARVDRHERVAGHPAAGIGVVLVAARVLPAGGDDADAERERPCDQSPRSAKRVARQARAGGCRADTSMLPSASAVVLFGLFSTNAGLECRVEVGCSARRTGTVRTRRAAGELDSLAARIADVPEVARVDGAAAGADELDVVGEVGAVERGAVERVGADAAARAHFVGRREHRRERRIGDEDVGQRAGRVRDPRT